VKFDIHDENENGRERFILGSFGATKLFVFGVNPSKANKEKSDTTITKVETFSRNLGFQGFVMLNIYPQRATNPDELNLDPNDNLVGRNTKIIRSQIQNGSQPQIWAAWGNLIRSRNYLWDCLSKIAEELKQFNPIWKHCGQPTKPGHPRHPSRLAYKEEFSKFDIFEYLKEGRIFKK
jgi:hypothetical protein